MQFEMAHLTCPLCKRELPANSPEQALSTQLCATCQKLVLAALRANSTAAAPAVAVAYSPASEPVEIDSRDFHSAGPSAYSELTSADSLAFDYESRPPIPLEEFGSDQFDFYQNDEPDEQIPLVRADSDSGSENEPSQEPATVFEGFVAPTITADHDPDRVDVSQLVAQPDVTELPVESGFDTTNLVEAQIEVTPLSLDEAATDPWENPLEPWDYSRSEWPALDATRQGFFSKKNYAIAAVVLIAFAAGFYFLVLRSSDSHPGGVTENGAKAKVSAAGPLVVPGAPAHSEAPATAAPTGSENPPAEASKPVETTDQQPVAGKDAQGQFSLQAAAFATQSGADEFAEKLKQAGLASYVVPADIARRGRWYRVRVGRFDSEESAQQFAAEAQRRARAGGIGVQLIVCQYGQP